MRKSELRLIFLPEYIRFLSRNKEILSIFSVPWFNRIARIVLAIILLFLFIVLLETGNLIPADNFDGFYEHYFQSFFPFHIIISLIWLFMSFGSAPKLRNEIEFLYSLPLSPTILYLRIIYLDFYKFAWIPLTRTLLFFTLVHEVHLAFILRLITLDWLLIVWIILFRHLMGFALLRLDAKHHHFPAHRQVITQIFYITIFFSGHIILVLFPTWITSHKYWLLLLAETILAVLFIPLGCHLFKIRLWQNHGIIGSDYEMAYSFQSATLKRRVTRVRVFFLQSPILYKNLLRMHRERFGIQQVVVFICFALALFFIAANNEDISGKINIIYYACIGYAFFFITGAMRFLSQPDEVNGLYYSLPIRKSDLYWGNWLPFAIWLLAIQSLAGFWLTMLAAHNWQSALTDGAKLLLVSLSFLTLAMGVILQYPGQTRKSETTFYIKSSIIGAGLLVAPRYWLFVIVIMSILFTVFAFGKSNFFAHKGTMND